MWKDTVDSKIIVQMPIIVYSKILNNYGSEISMDA